MKHTLKGEWITRRIWLDGKELLPSRSQRIRNHSPDGFNWSYGGSGPAQLALAVVLECTNRRNGYQDFKWERIATLPRGDFEIEFEM